jgi:chromosome segregation ATPase
MSLEFVLSSAAGILAFVLSVTFAIFRYAATQRERTIDDELKALNLAREAMDKAWLERHERLREAYDELKDALHKAQLYHLELEGEIKLVKQSHNGLSASLEALKDEMVTRDLYEARMLSVERTLRDVHAAVTGRYYGRSISPNPSDKPPGRDR